MFKRSNNQSYMQIEASTVIGDNELLNESNTRPLVLNADSDATEKIGMANTSRAISARIG
jgi:hypothetical protein